MVIDIIEHFSKFMWSYPNSNNDADNILVSLKSFCIQNGYPKILESDNRSEYKNKLIDEFYFSNNIKHIYFSPYHPSANGVVEVSYKEIRKNILISYHNTNFHSVTKYKPIDLINNDDEEIYKEAIKNI